MIDTLFLLQNVLEHHVEFLYLQSVRELYIFFMSNQQAIQFKNKGNEAFKAHRYPEAIEHFTKAIELNPNDHVFYSNRSVSYLNNKQYQQALQDAQKCVQIKPDWPRGYQRKGTALYYLEKHDEALETYKEGLKYDPNNAELHKNIKEIESKKAGGEPVGGAGGPGGDPNAMMQMYMKLMNNPENKDLKTNPTFMPILLTMMTNPQQMLKLLGDPRFKKIVLQLQKSVSPEQTEKEANFMNKHGGMSGQSAPKEPMKEEKPSYSPPPTPPPTPPPKKEQPKPQKMDIEEPAEQTKAKVREDLIKCKKIKKYQSNYQEDPINEEDQNINQAENSDQDLKEVNFNHPFAKDTEILKSKFPEIYQAIEDKKISSEIDYQHLLERSEEIIKNNNLVQLCLTIDQIKIYKQNTYDKEKKRRCQVFIDRFQSEQIVAQQRIKQSLYVLWFYYITIVLAVFASADSISKGSVFSSEIWVGVLVFAIYPLFQFIIKFIKDFRSRKIKTEEINISEDEKDEVIFQYTINNSQKFYQWFIGRSIRSKGRQLDKIGLFLCKFDKVPFSRILIERLKFFIRQEIKKITIQKESRCTNWLSGPLQSSRQLPLWVFNQEFKLFTQFGRLL